MALPESTPIVVSSSSVINQSFLAWVNIFGTVFVTKNRSGDPWFNFSAIEIEITFESGL
jgi:hypothetical protein